MLVDQDPPRIRFPPGFAMKKPTSVLYLLACFLQCLGLFGGRWLRQPAATSSRKWSFNLVLLQNTTVSPLISL